MSRLGRHRSREEEDVDINMVPIMNMFLVLIPFLLMSASFYQLKVINTSVPVLANSSGDDTKEQIIKVTAIIEIKEHGISLSAMSDALEPKELDKWSCELTKKKKEKYPLNQMALSLRKIKEKYPKSDTMILIPEDNIGYHTIILTMDAARSSNKEILFPNVVLSGKVG